MKTTGRNTQQGSVLIVSLIFLVVLTLLGIASVRSTSIQERMAFNTREQNLAFQAAEAALRDGELWLLAQIGNSQPPGTQASCASNCYSVPVWAPNTPASSMAGHTQAWWAANGRQHGQDTAGADTANLSADLHAAQPYYIIQQVNTAGMLNTRPGSLTQGFSYGTGGPYYYQVSAYGVGRTSYVDGGNTRHFDVVLQSLFSIPAF